MQLINGLFGSHFIVFSLAGLLALSIALSALCLLVQKALSGRRNRRPPRLQALEKVRLSPSRDAILIRCDNTEYLLLTGQGSDMVLEVSASEASAEGRQPGAALTMTATRGPGPRGLVNRAIAPQKVRRLEPSSHLQANR